MSEQSFSVTPANPPVSVSPGPGASFRWPLIIVTFLGGHIILMGIAAFLATQDRSFAVIPDYYRQGLRWDQQQEQQRRSDALGWKLVVAPDVTVDSNGQRQLKVRLTDADTQPVRADEVVVEFFHGAHANQRAQVRLGPSPEPGQYSAWVRMPYTGFWEFQIRAQTGTDTFVAALTQWVDTQSPPHPGN